MFVALEGFDACGKATQSKILQQALDGVLFSFPDYTTPMGKIILAHLKRYWGAEFNPEWPDAGLKFLDDFGMTADLLDPMVFQALQFANRLEKSPEIAAALKTGRHVVADRYNASAVAYGGADGLDPDYLWNTQRYLKQPSLQILLDIDVEDSLKRRPDRRDRYETMPKAYTEGLIRRYRELWIRKRNESANDRNLFSTRWEIIDGRRPTEEVTADIKAVIDEHFGWPPIVTPEE